MSEHPEVKGVLIFPDGTYEEKVFKQLSDYQSAVDGLIEPVRLFDGKGNDYATGYVNEEGLLQSLPLNTTASALSMLLGNNPMLVGNMIIVGTCDDEGYDTNINETLLNFIKDMCPLAKEQDSELV